MNSRIYTGIVALLLAQGAAAAALRAPDTRAKQATFVQLPPQDTGRLAVSACAACPTLRLDVVPTSSFIVNGKAVPLTTFRQILARNPRLMLTVAYYKAAQQLSRIIVTDQVRQ
jgi:hypothetical protein